MGPPTRVDSLVEAREDSIMCELLSRVYKGTVTPRDQGPGAVFGRESFYVLWFLAPFIRQDFILKILSLAHPYTLREVSLGNSRLRS